MAADWQRSCNILSVVVGVQRRGSHCTGDGERGLRGVCSDGVGVVLGHAVQQRNHRALVHERGSDCGLLCSHRARV